MTGSVDWFSNFLVRARCVLCMQTKLSSHWRDHGALLPNKSANYDREQQNTVEVATTKTADRPH